MNKDELIQSLSPYFKSRQGQIWILLLAAVILLLLVTFIWQVADSAALVKSGWQSSETDTIVSPVNTQPVLKTITEKPLFGQGELPGRVNTHFQLVGVLYTPVAKERKAIIGSPGNEPQMYAVGEQLKEGGKLYQVNADNVLLLINGQISKVLLLWEGGKTNNVAKNLTPSGAGDYQPDESVNVGVDSSADIDMSNAATAAVTGDDDANRPEAQAWRDRIKELQSKYQGQINQNNTNGNYNRPMPPKMRGMMRGID